MTSYHVGDSREWNTVTLHTIGKGFCGTVWAAEKGSAYKREDGGPDRSLRNDFEMHHRLLQSFQHFKRSTDCTHVIQIQIPACYGFIQATDQKWWSVNQRIFPPGYTPCNIIRSQRIPPFSENIRRLLVDKYFPPKIAEQIMSSKPDKDCLVRPYLGRRRTQRPHTASRFTAFSLRNFPLHLDQMEALGIATDDRHHYARIMAETLAIIHWVGNVDGNDIEFVLAPPNENAAGSFDLAMESNLFGRHSMWVLDFDLCRDMTMDSDGVKQAVAAFWRNDPYYPRPGRDVSLWTAFREHYLQISAVCIAVCVTHEVQTRCNFPRLFIDLVEGEARKGPEKKQN